VGVLAAVLALGLAVASVGAAAADEPAPAAEVLQDAFDRLFNYASVRRVRLRIHRGERVTERAFEVAYKRVAGRGSTLLRFSDPPYLRGTALLVLEAPGSRSDTWLYQPAQRRVRRVSTGHKGDSFFGTDLTFEDLEHHDWSRWDVRALAPAERDGLWCRRIEARAQQDSQYERIVAWLEPERPLLVRVDFYPRADRPPAKSLIVPAHEVEAVEGVWLPGRMWFLQAGRDASTEVVFERIERDPDLADEVFSAARLEHGARNLFQAAQRLRADP